MLSMQLCTLSSKLSHKFTSGNTVSHSIEKAQGINSNSTIYILLYVGYWLKETGQDFVFHSFY